MATAAAAMRMNTATRALRVMRSILLAVAVSGRE